MGSLCLNDLIKASVHVNGFQVLVYESRRRILKTEALIQGPLVRGHPISNPFGKCIHEDHSCNIIRISTGIEANKQITEGNDRLTHMESECSPRAAAREDRRQHLVPCAASAPGCYG